MLIRGAIRPDSKVQMPVGSGYQRAIANSVASVMVGILMELDVADPVPALKAPPVTHQWKQHFWGCAEAGERQTLGVERPAVAGSYGDDFHDPTCADRDMPDGLWRIFGL